MARNVRVSSISFPGAPGSGAEGVRARVASALGYVDRAAAERPDVIVLPEVFNVLGGSGDEWMDTAEPVPGPTTDAVAQRARKHGAYIVCPLFERRDEGVGNASVLIDREGEIVGTYYKIHPTIGEIEKGVVPGTEATVLETDFGKVGFAICYDLNFRDVMEGAAANGAELMFFSSMYRGGLQLSLWAFDFGVHLVSSTPGENSRIVSPLGRVLAESFVHSRIITKTLNLDCAVLHIDYNNAQFEALRKKYGKRIEMEVISPEAVLLLTSHHRNKTVDDLIDEFGLETRAAYFDRANRARRRALKKARK